MVGEALAWAGAAPDFLPEPVVAGTSCGRARLPGARGAVLTVAGHDHTCAAHGAGATGEGVVLDSCGTAEALVRALPAPVAEAVVAAAVGRGLNVGWHVLPGVMSMIGGFPSGKLLAGIDLQSAAAEPVLAALASRAAALLAAMDDLAGHHARIVVTGGWAREAAFQRSRRRAFGEHVTAAAGEAGVLGAALLAGRAAGLIDTSSQVKR